MGPGARYKDDCDGTDDDIIEEPESLEGMEPIRLYKDVKVCRQCYSVYCRLDRARRVWEESRYMPNPDIADKNGAARVRGKDKGVGLPHLTVRRCKISPAEKKYYLTQLQDKLTKPLKETHNTKHLSVAPALARQKNDNLHEKRQQHTHSMKQIKERTKTKFHVVEDKVRKVCHIS